MGDINSNEYVRTRDGKIGVFVKYSSRKDDSLYKCPANCFIRLNGRKSDLQCFRDYIANHSKNIIDLIEVGDIVEIFDVLNEDVIYIWSEEMLKALKEDIKNGIRIRRILTHEQFEVNSYKVKEE